MSFKIQREARFSNGEKEMSFLEDSFWRLRFLKSFEIRILQTNCTKKAFFWFFSTFFSRDHFASPLVKTWEPKNWTKQTSCPLKSNAKCIFLKNKKWAPKTKIDFSIYFKTPCFFRWQQKQQFVNLIMIFNQKSRENKGKLKKRSTFESKESYHAFQKKRTVTLAQRKQ